nr:uncharacterized protein LOC107441653 [Parasteatoda tepidariorum]
MGDLFYYRRENDVSSMVQDDHKKDIPSSKVVHISITKEDRKRAERLNKLREVVWEAFKGIVFIVCFGGFAYQISEFLIHFYTYPTTIDIEIQEPDNVIRPAVTICDTNPVKRSVFCSRYQSDCSYVEDPEKFCVDHPLYCGADLNMSNFYVPRQPFTRFEEKSFHRFRADFLNAYQPSGEVVKIEDSYKRARLEGPFYISCVMHHCYSLNNLAISNQQSKKRDIERNLKIFPSKETTPEKMGKYVLSI